MCMKGKTDAVKERFVIQEKVYFSWENRKSMFVCGKLDVFSIPTILLFLSLGSKKEIKFE